MGALDGKVVLVTGGGNGIGRDCALIAAQEGAKVVVNDLGGGLKGGDEGDAGPAEAVAREIRAAGGEAVSNSESVTSMKAVQGMVEQARDTFGGLHAVINPAGILRDVMFHKMSEDDWDRVIDVHMRGSFNVARATIELFREQNDGAYMFFTSTSGLFGNVGQANYGAAKMGIAGLSRIIAMEGARNNVRSNCLAPVAWTRMTQSVPVKDEAAAARRAVMAETIRADQPARFSVAMVAPAAAHVSGQIFGASGENIILYSQPRPVETVTKEEGWTVQSILDEAVPKMAPKFFDLNRGPLPGGNNAQAGRRQAGVLSSAFPGQVHAWPGFPTAISASENRQTFASDKTRLRPWTWIPPPVFAPSPPGTSVSTDGCSRASPQPESTVGPSVRPARPGPRTFASLVPPRRPSMRASGPACAAGRKPPRNSAPGTVRPTRSPGPWP
jgi:NAD(P)-dependent dehydrogenase (short-subunit alcohol dehydrogenase family)